MRNQQFEVPFIAFYRKEYVETELLITDLWQVFQWDEKVSTWISMITWQSKNRALTKSLVHMCRYSARHQY